VAGRHLRRTTALQSAICEPTVHKICELPRPVTRLALPYLSFYLISKLQSTVVHLNSETRHIIALVGGLLHIRFSYRRMNTGNVFNIKYSTFLMMT
jgi:hypothetical protein